MVRIVRVTALGAVLAAAFAFAPALASTNHGRPKTASASSGGILIPAYPGEVLPLGSKTIHSSNWSGYAVYSKGHNITGVTSTYIVPKVRPSTARFAATWAGIGGYKTHDLIQAGTGEDSRSSGLFGKQYFAWYELLPRSETQLRDCKGDSHCKVRPGDRITVAIRNTGRDGWTISMSDAGHWSWSKHVSYHSSRSSAEWILEAPSLGGGPTVLSPVGTVHFGPTAKYTSGGSSHRVAQGKPIRIILSGEAKPSALGSNGQSFNDCAYHSGSCPKP